MKWSLVEPQRGDMIRVKSGSIYHFGVYVSDDEIIQFGLAPSARPTLSDSEVVVCASGIDEFLCGGFLEVAELDRKELKHRIAPEETVSQARSRLGEGGYNILYNNCEHFATECVLGSRSCSQTDNVREFFKKLPILNVYLARIPDKYKFKPVHPKERKEYIEAAKNETVKRDRYFVWKLLEYALDHSFGKKIKKLNFKCENGRWSCAECKFSLSHSGDIVAVAISRQSVGIDVEEIREPRSEKFANRIMTDSESKRHTDSDALSLWCLKEAIFKMNEKDRFIPSDIETGESPCVIRTVSIINKRYYLAVASEHLGALKLYSDIDLSKI